MRNPFEYGGVVSGTASCSREKETLEDLRHAVSRQRAIWPQSCNGQSHHGVLRSMVGAGAAQAPPSEWPQQTQQSPSNPVRAWGAQPHLK
jgi:hypothetical protein